MKLSIYNLFNKIYTPSAHSEDMGNATPTLLRKHRIASFCVLTYVLAWAARVLDVLAVGGTGPYRHHARGRRFGRSHVAMED